MMDPTYCVKDGRVCVQVYDAEKKEWKYIPEDEWRRNYGN